VVLVPRGMRERLPFASHFDKDSAMSNLRLFDPVFNDNFDAAVRRFFAPTVFENELPALKMRLDVTENDKGYTVKADIPGVKKEDINVRIDGNVVQIDAEAKTEKETKDKGDKVLRSERCYGTISRTFSLASDVDESGVQAKYADGVLTLELPKKAAASARKITIQ
jgi:HSP20 family protein